MAAFPTSLGTALDKDGFRVAGTASEYEMAPRVAWDGTRFLVVWDQARSDGGQNGWGEIRGTFVSMDGCAAEGAGFVITPNPTRGMFPAFPVAEGRHYRSATWGIQAVDAGWVNRRGA